MADKAKLEEIKKLADAMYYAAQYLTTDASRLHKAMDEYHKFTIHEYKEEPVSEKKCIFAKDSYTDEDRKVLCEDCIEKCEYSKKEEPVSDVWHDMSEEAENGRNIIIIDPKDFYGAVLRKGGSQLRNHNKERYVKWAYIDDIINITNKEEPVSIDFEQELYKAFGQVKDFTLGMQIAKRFYEMGKQHQEPVSEDLEDAAIEICSEILKGETIIIDGYEYVVLSDAEECFKAGAEWQKENLWKPADGDDLPEIDREVIVLLNNGRVAFGHRPPEYWDGKDIITGKVTRNYVERYDKGLWNIPNIKYWLDIELPKEIEP